MKLFIRQSFTQADKSQSNVIQGVIDLIKELFPKTNFLTGEQASCSASFIENFEVTTGLIFTPKAFRNYRLALLDEADALLFIRTSMSESGAFELSYNLHAGSPKPVFYAHWRNAPIKTTLLKELDQEFPVRYGEFVSPKDLREPFAAFAQEYQLSANAPEFEKQDRALITEPA
ncbi:hypothetical protein [Thalassomonas actiniarum]|uniref:Uncharacterized protein n=1 Tax=Thalassomonas actiniarum TaxID=485447 RepID=A0AAE9YPC0_9GAMM|nr:hypothetical protein [Thalassomonas actiniarum]WDD97784.1 hypothetical protein SG35_021140 [Thalassomonas actiniarum]